MDLPGIINATDSDVLHPGFTPDGRYLGFVRFDHSGDHHLRLFAFDTQTQTLLNSNGIDLGNLGSFGCSASGLWLSSGGLSLRETFQLVHSSFTFTGSNQLVSFQLAQPTGVGILVQRIVGHHRLFGRVVPKLKTIGRVRFGRFRRWRHHVLWNLRVNGRRLRRGTYLVTPRLVTRKGVVHELGKLHIVRIR